MTIAGRAAAPAVLASAALGLVALVFGVVYAWTAYRISPAALPLALVAAAAIGIGVFRLEYGLALLVLMVPFTENAPISDPGAAKLRIALVLWAVLLVCVQGLRLVVTQTRITAPPLIGPALIFVACALLSVPVATNLSSAASKFLLIAGSVAIYALAALLLRRSSQLIPVLAALVAVSWIVALHAIYQYVTGDLSRVGFVSESGAVEFRIASFFPHPNQLAGFLAVLVPILIALIEIFGSRLARLAAGAGALLAIVATLLTYSRGALLALAALGLVYAARKAAWPAIIAAAVIAVSLGPSGFDERVAGIAETDRPEIATRIDFWEAALAMADSRPVLGIGLNNFAEAYLGLERAGRTFVSGGYLAAPETAHNLYLNTLAEQGVVGTLALLFLAVAVGRLARDLLRASDHRTRALGSGLLGVGVVLLVHNIFDVTFLDPKTATVVWTFLGVAAAGAVIARDPASGTAER